MQEAAATYLATRSVLVASRRALVGLADSEERAEVAVELILLTSGMPLSMQECCGVTPMHEQDGTNK